MVLTDRESLLRELRAAIGDALRVVATYDRDGYDPVYVRENVADRVDERADAVHEELVLQGIGQEYLEDLFGAGELQCSMHRFEDLTAFHFVAAEHTGLFVSLDSGADISLASFAGTCERHMEDTPSDSVPDPNG